jgi:hypothetical protein
VVAILMLRVYRYPIQIRDLRALQSIEGVSAIRSPAQEEDLFGGLWFD